MLGRWGWLAGHDDAEATAFVRRRLAALTPAPAGSGDAVVAGDPVGDGADAGAAGADSGSADWVPARGRRWDRPAARLTVALLAVGVLASGWWWWGSREATGRAEAPAVLAQGTPLAVAASGVAAVPSGSAVSPSSGPAALVVVHVIGPVRRPGVLRLPAGSRVADAVAAAGGLRPGADAGAVNLARVLVDGEQVRVGPGAPADGAPAASVPGGPATSSGLVDLNTAGLAELDALPGVGPVLAQRILDFRAERGRFTSVDELREVPGIGEKTFADLRPRVRA